MGFSRQEYWSRLPFPSPGDLPDPGIEPESLALAGRILGAMKGEAKPCPHVAYSLPERTEMVTKGKSKICRKRDGSK